MKKQTVLQHLMESLDVYQQKIITIEKLKEVINEYLEKEQQQLKEAYDEGMKEAHSQFQDTVSYHGLEPKR